MSVLWVFLHLLILSWEDMKDQMLSFWLLLELLLTGLLTALWNGREMVWFPGLLLLVVGKLRTVIGRESNIYPLSSVRGVVPSRSIYKKQGEVATKHED